VGSSAWISAASLQAPPAPTQAQLAPTVVQPGDTLFPTAGPIVAAVSLLATVESDGHVSGTQAVDSIGSTWSGEPYGGTLIGYVENSIAAVTRWRFSPTIDLKFKRTRSIASITFVYDRVFSTNTKLLAMRTISPKADDYVPPLPSTVARAEYPLDPRLRVIGTVVLKLQIEERGSISDVEVVQSICDSGSAHCLNPSNSTPLLDQASVHAAWNWQFRPASYRGKPIRSTTTIAFVFGSSMGRPGGVKQ
jgi:TonB family protein